MKKFAIITIALAVVFSGKAFADAADAILGDDVAAYMGQGQQVQEDPRAQIDQDVGIEAYRDEQILRANHHLKDVDDSLNTQKAYDDSRREFLNGVSLDALKNDKSYQRVVTQYALQQARQQAAYDKQAFQDSLEESYVSEALNHKSTLENMKTKAWQDEITRRIKRGDLRIGLYTYQAEQTDKQIDEIMAPVRYQILRNIRSAE